MTPPNACPCGRPRSGGTLIEIDHRSRALSGVEYLHADGWCVWVPLAVHRAPGVTFWYRTFMAVPA